MAALIRVADAYRPERGAIELKMSRSSTVLDIKEEIRKNLDEDCALSDIVLISRGIRLSDDSARVIYVPEGGGPQHMQMLVRGRGASPAGPVGASSPSSPPERRSSLRNEATSRVVEESVERSSSSPGFASQGARRRVSLSASGSVGGTPPRAMLRSRSDGVPVPDASPYGWGGSLMGPLSSSPFIRERPMGAGGLPPAFHLGDPAGGMSPASIASDGADSVHSTHAMLLEAHARAASAAAEALQAAADAEEEELRRRISRRKSRRASRRSSSSASSTPQPPPQQQPLPPPPPPPQDNQNPQPQADPNQWRWAQLIDPMLFLRLAAVWFIFSRGLSATNAQLVAAASFLGYLYLCGALPALWRTIAARCGCERCCNADQANPNRRTLASRLPNIVALVYYFVISIYPHFDPPPPLSEAPREAN